MQSILKIINIIKHYVSYCQTFSYSENFFIIISDTVHCKQARNCDYLIDIDPHLNIINKQVQTF